MSAALDDLQKPVTWLGDSLGNDDYPTISLRDAAGRLCDTSPGALLAHSVWGDLDHYSRRRIEAGLIVAGMPDSESVGVSDKRAPCAISKYVQQGGAQ